MRLVEWPGLLDVQSLPTAVMTRECKAKTPYKLSFSSGKPSDAARFPYLQISFQSIRADDVGTLKPMVYALFLRMLTESY